VRRCGEDVDCIPGLRYSEDLGRRIDISEREIQDVAWVMQRLMLRMLHVYLCEIRGMGQMPDIEFGFGACDYVVRSIRASWENGNGPDRFIVVEGCAHELVLEFRFLLAFL